MFQEFLSWFGISNNTKRTNRTHNTHAKKKKTQTAPKPPLKPKSPSKSRSKSRSQSRSKSRSQSRSQSRSRSPSKSRSVKNSPSVQKIAMINQHEKGKRCIRLMKRFVENPPNEVFLGAKGLETCNFEITKILLRMNSIQNARLYDYQFVFQPFNDQVSKYETGKWWLLGGTKAKRVDEMKTFLPSEVLQYLCSSLVKSQGNARLEVEISLKNVDNTAVCNPVMWKDGIDDEMQSLTRAKSHLSPSGIRKRQQVIQFNTPYPAELFEFQLPNTLRYIFDFSRNKQISIWDNEELTFQEKWYQKQ